MLKTIDGMRKVVLLYVMDSCLSYLALGRGFDMLCISPHTILGLDLYQRYVESCRGRRGRHISRG